MEIGNKEEIRKRIAELRRLVTAEEKSRWDTAIRDRLFLLPQMENISGVYCYIDIRNEAGTRQILEKLWEQKIPAAVPKVIGRDMEFSRIGSWEDVSPGCMGIPEPVRPDALPDEFDRNPLVLAPAVALDKKGNRVGYGGGYYDRFLAAHPQLETVGLCYGALLLPRLPAAPHDQRVRLVAAEAGAIPCAAQAPQPGKERML